MSKKEKVTTTNFNLACTQVLCMHAWEFSDGIYNTLLRKRGVFIRLKPAQVFNWPFQAILFQQDSLKRKISKVLLTKICFFRSSQRHLVHALWILAKHCGNRSQNACQAMSFFVTWLFSAASFFSSFNAHCNLVPRVISLPGNEVGLIGDTS